jgi:preprotein translocase subunit SecG
MMTVGLLAVGLILKIAAVLFILAATALILVVLIQKGRGGGLSGALAGGMASGLLGSKTGDFLTWVTIVLAGVFIMFAVVLAKFYRPTVRDFGEPPPPSAVDQTQRPVAPVETGPMPQQTESTAPLESQPVEQAPAVGGPEGEAGADVGSSDTNMAGGQ